MTEHPHGQAPGEEVHAQPHMPPNSFIPIVMGLSLALLFVGFLSQVRQVVGPVMWLAGLLGVIGCCAMWAVSARREYQELPEEGGH